MGSSDQRERERERERDGGMEERPRILDCEAQKYADVGIVPRIDIYFPISAGKDLGLFM